MPPDTLAGGAVLTETSDDAPTSARRAALARARAGELLGPADMQAIFQISRATFFKRNRIHAFDCFRVHPPIGPKCFSGVLVTRYLDGEPIGEIRQPRWRTR